MRFFLLLRKQCLCQVNDGADGNKLNGSCIFPLELTAGGFREQQPLKSQARSLAQPHFHLSHSAHLTSQTDFATHRGCWINGLFKEAGEQRRDHAHIQRRLHNADAAGDVEKNIVVK